MQPVMIYIVSDGKPGHLAQSRGLAQAIGRHIPARIMEIDAQGKRVAPQPHKDNGLILAAGRGTHKLAISLRKYLGLPAVSLMNPGWLGRQRFDLSVIPRHDGIAESNHVLVTEGALNDITPATDNSPSEGLLLIGGPSKHHGWDEGAIRKQLETILEREPSMRWTATDSRRTPEATSDALCEIASVSDGRLNYVPSTQTPRGWVAEQLQRCGVCWVSEDSVSMVYEALTAGARVGLLSVPRQGGKPGRVVRGITSLVERGWVGIFDQWQRGTPLPVDRPVLAEADRVASSIVERWLSPSKNT